MATLDGAVSGASATPGVSASDALLLAYVASHDADCPVCGYNCRGAPACACPECGTPLSLALRAPGVVLGPWVAATIWLSMAAGFDAVACVLILIQAALSWPISAFAVLLVLGPMAIALIATLLGLWGVVATRRRWWRVGVRAQWARAIAIGIAVVVAHGLLGLVMAGLMR